MIQFYLLYLQWIDGRRLVAGTVTGDIGGSSPTQSEKGKLQVEPVCMVSRHGI